MKISQITKKLSWWLPTLVLILSGLSSITRAEEPTSSCEKVIGNYLCETTDGNQFFKSIEISQNKYKKLEILVNNKLKRPVNGIDYVINDIRAEARCRTDGNIQFQIKIGYFYIAAIFLSDHKGLLVIQHDRDGDMNSFSCKKL
ncbi:MAG: hypothetical protein ACXVCY_02300 [Pseudobdellovibrionaceae bacterium]